MFMRNRSPPVYIRVYAYEYILRTMNACNTARFFCVPVCNDTSGNMTDEKHRVRSCFLVNGRDLAVIHDEEQSGCSEAK